jgi:heme-degrading monooxygenase HmoA
MFVVHNRIEAPAEIAETFEKNFVESMRATLAGVPGLVRSTLMRPAESGQPYVSTMEFDSKESFFNWMKSDSFRSSHSDSGAPGMQAPSAIESFTVIEDVRI